jgi:sulfur carrier protein
MDTFSVTVNGQAEHVEAGITLGQWLRAHSLEGKRIAVEYNGEILPRSSHEKTPLRAGDCLEIVVAVGGG